MGEQIQKNPEETVDPAESGEINSSEKSDGEQEADSLKNELKGLLGDEDSSFGKRRARVDAMDRLKGEVGVEGMFQEIISANEEGMLEDSLMYDLIGRYVREHLLGTAKIQARGKFFRRQYEKSPLIKDAPLREMIQAVLDELLSITSFDKDIQNIALQEFVNEYDSRVIEEERNVEDGQWRANEANSEEDRQMWLRRKKHSEAEVIKRQANRDEVEEMIAALK
ncbi:hypothetical protein HN358_01070 [Candidatus Uhrbacteria bacterium]|jgi:hypothetical protein|nr:hypothetical protein [Candidatus Uhrbacteria bacterium]MBT7717475.1 hypothetical protein [Candidatus Uhrbacteria bacterium]